MTKVTLSGPVLTGAGAPITEAFVDEAVYQMGAQALANVQTVLDRRVKNPTPYYETQITLQRVGPGAVKVHDRRIVYGPWLEGTSPRNRSTRFKGYHAFRTAREELNQQSQRILASLIPQFVKRLGG